MPGKIKVKVLAGRNLPVMDRASDTTDAFVEIKFGSVTHKTDVCRKSLNPHWNSTEWYRFEVDESELQDEPLQLRLMDHDTYSANDAIGKVVISLAPLLAREANNIKCTGGPTGAVLSGWIPVFDTMHGIRGELNIIVKVELFSDFNKYKTSSCGVQFFHCPSIPPGYKATAIHGFVEELVVNDDPEYQWIDKIRTPRASNEARQVAFIKLSNQVQRLVGLKAAELGANAVLGYQQDFDLEGEAGVVARAIGTAVSLIPPPTPNQSISIPPCTQQQLKKYLDILATDNESITDLNQYFQSHRDELQKLLSIMNPNPALLDDPDNIDDDEKTHDFTRTTSMKSYTSSYSIYQDNYASQKSLRHISEDQTDLNKLLNRNDESDSDSTGALQKIKKIKTNFTKRLGSLRSRKSDARQDDTVSLKSDSSDNSRISLTDIKNEFKKLKRLKKTKFRKTFVNNQDEGIGMASILARSVIHAHTSLACIAEKDSEHSPSSTMRRTSESEPTINISDDERRPDSAVLNDHKVPGEKKIKVPEIHTSLKNVIADDLDTTTRQRKLSESCPSTPVINRSENLLKLPGEVRYFGSISLSGDSSDAYTSSEEDDDSSDQNADTDKGVETTSSVVQSVLNNDVNPAIVAHMDRKLSFLDGTLPELKESKSHGLFKNVCDLEDTSFIETSKSSPCIHKTENNTNKDLESKTVSQPSTSGFCKETSSPEALKTPHNLHFKFHNPFMHKKVSQSISAPSSPVKDQSFVYRYSNRIKRQLSKIYKSNVFKSFSQYSLLSKKKRQPCQAALSQPSSMSNIISKVNSETVLGSPFLSYADLMSLDKEGSDARKKLFYVGKEVSRPRVKMYIGSEPVSRTSLSGLSSPSYKDESFDYENSRKREEKKESTGLVHTAIETILIDKVQSLLVPATVDSKILIQSKEQQFFNDVNKKLEVVEEARNLSYDLKVLNNKDNSLSVTSEGSNRRDNGYPVDDACKNHSRERSKERKKKDESLIETAVKTMLIEKVQSFIPKSSEVIVIKKDGEKYHKNLISKTDLNNHDKKHNFIHTAMETVLLDKLQSLVPTSAELVKTDKAHINVKHEREQKVNEHESNSSYVHDQKENVFTDNIKELKKGSRKSVVSSISETLHNFQKPKVSHNSLLHTAVETLLMDKVQTLIPSASEPVTPEPTCDHIFEKKVSLNVTQLQENSRNMKNDDETIPIDKFQALVPSGSAPVISEDINYSNSSNGIVSNVSYLSDKGPKTKGSCSSLFNNAMETILTDKVQAYVLSGSKPVKPEPISNIISTNSIASNVSHMPVKDKKRKSSHSSLLHTAMETILMDKVQVLIPPGSEPATPEPMSHCTSRNGIISNASQLLEKGQTSTECGNSLFHTAMETILMDKAQAIISSVCQPVTVEPVSKDSVVSSTSHITEGSQKTKHSSLLHTAMETTLLDEAQTLILSSDSPEKGITSDASQISDVFEKGNDDSKLSQTVMASTTIQNIPNYLSLSDSNNLEIITSEIIAPHNKEMVEAPINFAQFKETEEKELPNNEIRQEQNLVIIGPEINFKIREKTVNVYETKEKKLIRQDSVHSLPEDHEESHKMSKELGANLIVPSRVTHTKPVLQHFHPIRSGKPLETIPSLPESSSLDHSESLDVDGVERICDCQSDCLCKVCISGTNSASVCDNSHAACDVDRNEREREKCEKDKGSPRHARHESYGGREPMVMSQPTQNSSFISSAPMGIHRRSSDSDLSVTPKGSSLNASIGNTGSGGGAILRPSMNSSNIEMLEYPFLTMTEYPPGLIVHLGGTVCARSVKLVDAGGESAARAAWWAELRTELRAHARALRCNAVIAYTESAAICEDVCVLSASGTAAVINLDCDLSNELDTASALGSNGYKDDPGSDQEYCSVAHLPYSPGTGPYRAELSTCGGCRRARVPAVLLATCAKPSRLPSYAKAVTVTAVAARIRRAPPTAEPGARDISDQLPFLEYELHKLLLAKLRMQGANALFSLQTQIAIGERCVMALASGTALRLVTLPPPTPPRIKASESDKNALEIQRAIWDSFTANKAANGYDIGGSADQIAPGALAECEGEEGPALDLCADKEACVLELDEAEDVETAKTLAVRRILMPVFTNTSKPAPGAPPHMFAQVWRARLVLSLAGGGASSAAERHVARALDGVTYKLRRLNPCALTAPRFQLELPEDEIQLVVSGAAIPLLDPNKPEQNTHEMNYGFTYNHNGSPVQQIHSHFQNQRTNSISSDNEDDIFALDEEQLVKPQPPSESQENEDKSLVLNGQVPSTVSLTTLGHISGSRAERRICALRLLFVRETTAVRELGGLSGFLHTFTCEVLAIVRAYTAALGGNALTSFYITQLMLQDNAHKNQGQCLLSVGGDVVHITY